MLRWYVTSKLFLEEIAWSSIMIYSKGQKHSSCIKREKIYVFILDAIKRELQNMDCSKKLGERFYDIPMDPSNIFDYVIEVWIGTYLICIILLGKYVHTKNDLIGVSYNIWNTTCILDPIIYVSNWISIAKHVTIHVINLFVVVSHLCVIQKWSVSIKWFRTEYSIAMCHAFKLSNMELGSQSERTRWRKYTSEEMWNTFKFLESS